MAIYIVIDELRKSETEGMSLEDLVALSALGRGVQSEFATLNIEEPEFLGPKLREIRREIAARQADRIEKLLREKKARLEALQPAEEKRAALKAEIDKLEAQLSGTP